MSRRLAAWASVAALATATALGSACEQPVVVAPPPGVAPCAPGTFAIAGVCLSAEDAAVYCGKGAKPEGGGCAPIVCREAEPVDLATGQCVPVLTLRRLESRGRLRPDAGVGCSVLDAGLVVEGESFACLPHASLCGRGARWADGACRPDPVCPPGTIADPHGACAAVLTTARGERVLDVGAWIRLMIGPDEGEGTAAVCGPLLERPWRAGVIAHGSRAVEVQVDLVFPDNEVKAASARVHAETRYDPRTMSARTPVAVGKYLEPLWNTLHALGGIASAASASVRVACTLDGGGNVLGAPAQDGEAPPPPHHHGKRVH